MPLARRLLRFSLYAVGATVGLLCLLIGILVASRWYDLYSGQGQPFPRAAADTDGGFYFATGTIIDRDDELGEIHLNVQNYGELKVLSAPPAWQWLMPSQHPSLALPVGTRVRIRGYLNSFNPREPDDDVLWVFRNRDIETITPKPSR